MGSDGRTNKKRRTDINRQQAPRVYTVSVYVHRRIIGRMSIEATEPKDQHELLNEAQDRIYTRGDEEYLYVIDTYKPNGFHMERSAYVPGGSPGEWVVTPM
jgi:hypothetical protein